MTAPGWIADIVADFGRAAGLDGFALSDRGVAAMSFENGMSLRFEYCAEELVVAVTVPCAIDSQRAKALLSAAHPDSGAGFRVRTGYIAKSGKAVFAVRIPEREVTLPFVNAVFSALWRTASEFGGAA